MSRLPVDVVAALWAVLGDEQDDGPDGELVAGELDGEVGAERSFFNELKADPGRLGLETLLSEIVKLRRVRAIGLPGDVFADVAEKRIARWRARAAAEYPSTLRRDHRPEVNLTLLAVLCWCRLTEVTDSLVELFIDLVRVINTRAERRVEREKVKEFRRVGDKEGVLFKLADVSLRRPDDAVRDVVFPAVGEQTLKDLVAEAKATESRRRQRVRTVLASSYSHHYRTMLPKLLDALEFRCNNTAYRPVMDAVELLHRYKDRDGRATHYDRADRPPLDGVVKADWRPAVVDERGRVERIPYELCTLQALRDAVRRREIWVVGARSWRDPEADLPGRLRPAPRRALHRDRAADRVRHRLAQQGGHGIGRAGGGDARWDVRGVDRRELRKRVLLVLFALGTNIGVKRIVNAGDHGATEAQLRRTRHLLVNRDGLRRAIASVVNATLRERDERWWGSGTACASDSKKFGSWESNLMTEWHARYGGPVGRRSG